MSAAIEPAATGTSDTPDEGGPLVFLAWSHVRHVSLGMNMGRREFLAAAVAVAVVGPSSMGAQRSAPGMYGLIGKMTATPGQRDALIAILLEGIDVMPGCRSYVVATDPADANAIWITEVWDDKASHDASLSLPSVRQTIARARPLIVGFGDHTVTVPVGGYGLGAAGAC